ncbi:MAG: GTP-binding protein [Hyphomicrobiaceae bacterium TMED74]|nr:GTP-binding protein [Filomicrobium sp.]RPG47360.1 MAG: GTP-binding protein [Hyphomicrobiaceae bacterium TMED74]
MIPVSVITGYLGSGKTTILKKLLAHDDFRDTAVIINEFGEIGLDHDLIETSDEDLVTLKTGCLCCKMRGDLVETLDNLLTRREAGEIAPFKRVVIETSGLADPIPILQGLMVDETAAQKFELQRVVTTVDAVHGLTTTAREPEAAKQVAVADRLVLTKSDQLQQHDDELSAAILELNPSTRLIVASHGALAPEVVFGSDPSTEQAARLNDLTEIAFSSTSEHSHANGSIQTFAIVRDRPIAAVALTLFLEALADHCGEGLLRMKGLICIDETPNQPAVVHGVQHVFHPLAWLDDWPSDDHRTRIVFIGRNLSEALINALLRAIEIEVGEFAEEQSQT